VDPDVLAIVAPHLKPIAETGDGQKPRARHDGADPLGIGAGTAPQVGRRADLDLAGRHDRQELARLAVPNLRDGLALSHELSGPLREEGGAADVVVAESLVRPLEESVGAVEAIGESDVVSAAERLELDPYLGDARHRESPALDVLQIRLNAEDLE